jgi:hypothetical protein
MIEMRYNKGGGDKIYFFGLNDSDLERLKQEKMIVLSDNRLHPTRMEYVEPGAACIEVDQMTTTVCKVDDEFLAKLQRFAKHNEPAATFPLPRFGHSGCLAYGKTDEECEKNIKRRLAVGQMAAEWTPR